MAKSGLPYPPEHPLLKEVWERVCLYLNFEDTYDGRMEGWGAIYHNLQHIFDEYRRAYLQKASEIEDIGLVELQKWCDKKKAFQSKQYTSASMPNKAGWKPLDHAARFIVQALQDSWKIGEQTVWTQGEWDPESDGDESDLEFWQAWLVLRYFQTEWEKENVDGWNDQDTITDIVGQLSSNLNM